MAVFSSTAVPNLFDATVSFREAKEWVSSHQPFLRLKSSGKSAGLNFSKIYDWCNVDGNFFCLTLTGLEYAYYKCEYFAKQGFLKCNASAKLVKKINGTTEFVPQSVEHRHEVDPNSTRKFTRINNVALSTIADAVAAGEKSSSKDLLKKITENYTRLDLNFPVPSMQQIRRATLSEITKRAKRHQLGVDNKVNEGAEYSLPTPPETPKTWYWEEPNIGAFSTARTSPSPPLQKDETFLWTFLTAVYIFMVAVLIASSFN